jgi:uncharacterized protein
MRGLALCALLAVLLPQAALSQAALAKDTPPHSAQPHHLPPLKIVYQVNEGVEQAAHAMANIRNTLAEVPDAQIVVVALSKGVDFLVLGAKDKDNNPFDATVEDLTSRGVVFEACGNTMKARNISMSQILPQAKQVRSGMVEIAERQFRQHYAYIRP